MHGSFSMYLGVAILNAVYVVLRTAVEYRDLGTAYLDVLDAQRTAANLVRRLERLGYYVTLEARGPAPEITEPAPAG